MNPKSLTLFLFAATGLGLTAHADVIEIVSAGPDANIRTISQVVLSVTDDTGTTLVMQNAPSSGGTLGVTSAVLQSLTIDSGVLDSFTFAAPVIANDTFPNSNAPGIQVLTPTQAVGVEDADFLDSLANTYANGDLVNYLRVDGGNFTPTWDAVYTDPLNTDNFLIFEERDGNTTFTVDPLDVAGNPISDGNTLSFDGNSYQWSIGYSNDLDPNGQQAQVLGVIDFDLFGTSTPIGGFRINDTGNADFKFFVGSLAVPEPGTAGVVALLGLASVLRRRR